MPGFEGRILAVDTPVAQRCARLHVLPDPRSERDALIAATALVHGMTVVTRNVADFTPTGVPVSQSLGGLIAIPPPSCPYPGIRAGPRSPGPGVNDGR